MQITLTNLDGLRSGKIGAPIRKRRPFSNNHSSSYLHSTSAKCGGRRDDDSTSLCHRLFSRRRGNGCDIITFRFALSTVVNSSHSSSLTAAFPDHSSVSPAAMSFQWRRFQFFDKDSYTDEDSKPALSALNDFPDISASTSSPRHLLFASTSGRIRLLDRHFEPTTFQAHDGVILQLIVLKRAPVLISLGEEEGGVIKVWLLDRLDASGVPLCVKRLNVFGGKFPVASITALAVMDDMSQACVGCVNGQALLLDGHIIKEKHPKPSYLIKDIGPPVTALHYREDEGATAAPPSLFVLTGSSLSSYYTKHTKPTRIELDGTHGADPLLSCLTEPTPQQPTTAQRLIVARKEAVYTYDVEEQSEVFAFEGVKKIIGWYNNYLILVTDGAKDSTASAAASTSSGAVKDQLTLYDLKNKFIAFQIKSDPVMNLLPAFNSLYTLTSPQPSQYALQHYIEKDLSSKIDILFKKNLYPIAISLATSQSSDASLILDIYQQYADHSYDKGDYDQAIIQYIETIGYTEPSYVIRKFLDAQRIHNLTKYLQSLHEKGKANADHTTLLINCYTKLKDVDKLDEFVKTADSHAYRFDVATAIQVCRQAGYYHHALYMAQHHQQHDLYIKTMLEDVNDSTAALQYVRSLSWPEADHFIRKYGKRFVSDLPQPTTETLIQLTTHWQPSPLPGSNAPALPAAQSSEKSAPEHFVHFFVDHSGELQVFLEKVQHEPHCTSVVYNTLLELYLRRGEEEEHKKREAREEKGTTDGGGSGANVYGHQIMTLLKSFNGKYDMDHALVLCKLYRFEKGILYLYAKLSYFNEILLYHIEHNQPSKIIPVCNKYGATVPQLWVQALQYFAQRTDDNYQEEIGQVLEVIERMQLLAPLMVVNILAGKTGSSGSGDSEQKDGGGGSSGGASPESAGMGKPLSVIQNYIVKLLKQETSAIDADKVEIARYAHDSAQMETELERLRTQPIVFQVGKCSGCGAALSLPAVHFLCGHSYHTRCCEGGRAGREFSDGESSGGGGGYECVKCAVEYRKVREIKDSLRSSVNAHDRFFKQLEDSADGFATVAEYFGRGVFDTDGQDDLGL